MTVQDQARRLRIRLEEALRSHLVSDVPIGLFLSGGLDSSGLGALMASMVPEPIKTFSVGFRDTSTDETGWARLAAAAIGADDYETVVTARKVFDALPHLVWQEDERIAFPSSIPRYFLSRLAAGHVKVVMSGEGADELFLGYNRYRVTAWNERLAAVYAKSMPRRVRQAVQARIAGLPGKAGRYLERSFLGQDSTTRGLFFENFSVFPTAMQAQVLRDPRLLYEHDPYASASGFYQAAPGGSLERMGYAELQTYLV